MNVVVVAAHGLNCHWLGLYGNPWIATPSADALAVESIVFDHHFADEAWPDGFRRGCPPTLFGALQASGVTTILVDDRKDRSTEGPELDLVVPSVPDGSSTPGRALLAAVRSALDRVANRTHWLVWIETDRLLPPWDLELETYQHYASAAGGFTAEGVSSDDKAEAIAPTDEPSPGSFDENDDQEWHRLRNSFAAAVTSFDTELGEFVREFRHRGLDRSAVWILTAGYGYPLGEHGVVGPAGSRLHEELVHLPLIVRRPAQRQAMRRVRDLTQASDLASTLADLFAIRCSSDLTGRSLLPLFDGMSIDWRQAVQLGAGHERAIRTADWAFLAASAEPARLYRKPDDLWEVNDLAARYPDECDRLATLLDAITTKDATA